MARAITQETQQLEMDLNEERSRYQNLLTEHLRLEEKYDDLKEEMTSLVSLSSGETLHTIWMQFFFSVKHMLDSSVKT